MNDGQLDAVLVDLFRESRHLGFLARDARDIAHDNRLEGLLCLPDLIEQLVPGLASLSDILIDGGDRPTALLAKARSSAR